SAVYLLVLANNGKALACGRLHLNSPAEAQVRYMAVDENVQGRGYGSAILAALEAEAARLQVSQIVLNARDNAVEFYRRHGYVAPSKCLYGLAFGIPQCPLDHDCAQASLAAILMKPRLTLILSLCLISLFTAPGLRAQEGSIKQAMSPEEFHGAGLDKLSDNELKNLDRWLQGDREKTAKKA